MELIVLIESAEKQFIQILERYFLSIYDESKLPSHGLSHHRRVWGNAKQLLLNLPGNKCVQPRLPFTLIIACYMHDLGMAIDHGPRHGRQSMELCSNFMHENHLDEDDFPGLKHAIREHDNKSYTYSATVDALTLLSIADDLDAFGFTGIYRYTEIYALRGISPRDLGKNVRENALNRFEHFRKLFEKSGGFFDEQKKKYLILDNFFMQYDRDLDSNEYDGSYSEVVNLLSGIVIKKNDIHDLTIANHSDNPVADWFFRGLSSENQGS